MRRQLGMTARGVAILCAVLLGGCAPFAVNWYVEVPTDPDRGPGDLLITVANRSDKSCTVDKIILNPSPDGGGYRWSTGSGASALTLRPGELIVVPLSQFERPVVYASCVLPSTVSVMGSCSWVLPSPGPNIRMSAGLPNLMPDVWRDCLRVPKPPEVGTLGPTRP